MKVIAHMHCWRRNVTQRTRLVMSFWSTCSVDIDILGWEIDKRVSIVKNKEIKQMILTIQWLAIWNFSWSYFSILILYVLNLKKNHRFYGWACLHKLCMYNIWCDHVSLSWFHYHVVISDRLTVSKVCR